MKLAIMQPYLFPYIGYFQLIRAVDAFVVYDDVAYRKGGMINRNYVLANDRRQRLTMSVLGGSPNRLINQIEVGSNKPKLLKTIRHCYARAPYFDAVFPILIEVLSCPVSNLALFLDHQLKRICDYLDLCPVWKMSSELNKNDLLRGQDRVLEICGALGASRYINLPGGAALYDPLAFANRGIELAFLRPGISSYGQYGAPFVPNLSIIDVLMFNGKEGTRQLLEVGGVVEAPISGR